MKRYSKWLFSAMILILVAVGLSVNLWNPKQAYKQIKTDEDFQTWLDQDEAYLYVSQTDCKYCHIFEPKLAQAIEQTGVEVYEYNIQLAREDKQIEVENHINHLKLEFTPAMYKIEKGELTYSNLDSKSTVEEITNFLNR